MVSVKERRFIMLTFLQVFLLAVLLIAVYLVARVIELAITGYISRKQFNQKVDDTLAKLSREFMKSVTGVKWGDK